MERVNEFAKTSRVSRTRETVYPSGGGLLTAGTGGLEPGGGSMADQQPIAKHLAELVCNAGSLS